MDITTDTNTDTNTNTNTNTTVTITYTKHPLNKLITKAERAQRDALKDADELIEHEREHGYSSGSVYIVRPGDGRKWSFVGPVEDYGHLVGQDRDHIVVHNPAPAGQREWLASVLSDVRVPVGLGRAKELRDAALVAAPMVEILLAALVHRGVLTWDTDETVAEAAERLCLDAAHEAVVDPGAAAWWGIHDGPATPSMLFRAVAQRVLRDSFADTPISEFAQTYLATRRELRRALWRENIEWGARLLTAKEAAHYCGVSESTFRAYVSRGQAPTADVPGGKWRVCTLMAWLATRRAGIPGWC